MLFTKSCKHCRQKFPVDWMMIDLETRVCLVCEILGPQEPGPGYNLCIVRKEPKNGQKIRRET
jgi:hypothetical protein